MKIRIAVTVEVDRQAWAETYGIFPDQVRDDVNNWAANQLYGHPEGLIKHVEDKR